MPFCPNCREEYREGFRTCADCGAELVRELPPIEKPARKKLPDNIDELVALDVMEELDWPMISEGRPVPPARFPDEHFDRPLPAMAGRLEALGVPALLLTEGSSFDGVTVFGVTLEAEGLYIPEDVLPDIGDILKMAPLLRKPKRYWLNRDFLRD